MSENCKMSRARANPKPKFKASPPREWLSELSGKVHYTGNPAHKLNPGDFGLTPPSSPRPDKTLCDGARIFQKEEAQELLREAIRRGLVSEQDRNGYPQKVWAVSNNGVPLEAQLENQDIGTYHGYPLQEDSAPWHFVLERWKAQS
jgi:hypothetical protein